MDRRDFLKSSTANGAAFLTLWFTGCASDDAADPGSVAEGAPFGTNLTEGDPERRGALRADGSNARVADAGADAKDSGPAKDGAIADSAANGDPDADVGDAEASDAAASDVDAAVDGSAIVDASPDVARPTVTLYDTNAVALYFDGSMGPYTGVIKVAYVLANAPLTLDFWHGHNGQQHRFTLLPAHFDDLKKKERVTLETSVVDGHNHKLFIDPVDPRYRVAGAPPVEVPV